MMGGHRISALLTFPPVDGPLGLRDLAFAALLGIAGGALGLVYGKALMTTRLRTQKLRTRPWLAALAGGVPIALRPCSRPTCSSREPSRSVR